MYTIKGQIKQISPAQQVTDKFRKREFVLTDNSSQYPQHVQFQLTQDKCDLLDAYKVGDEVELGFYLRGREYTDKKTGGLRYFNSLDVFKISGVSKNASADAGVPEEPFNIVSGDDTDDLPF